MSSSLVPEIVFIVPYRDRERHRTFFRSHMKTVLEDLAEGSYRIYFVHQNDTQPFNRGAIKNIGFLAMKKEYPDDYKNITFVFNDVDVMPFEKNMLFYKTIPGVVKHFYGFNFTLGGIVSITGGDFEKINGFPNFWAWGWEDNELQSRVSKTNGISIDRSTFFDILSKDFMHLHHGAFREVNAEEKRRFTFKTMEGIKDVVLGKYEINGDMIEVTSFSTGTRPNIASNSLISVSDSGKTLGSRKPRIGMQMTSVRY
jgi:hypothetical protein